MAVVAVITPLMMFLFLNTPPSPHPVSVAVGQYSAWVTVLPPTSTLFMPSHWHSWRWILLSAARRSNAAARARVLPIAKLCSTVAESELRLRGAKLLMTDAFERLFNACADQEIPIALRAQVRAASVLCTDEAIVIVMYDAMGFG